MQKDRPLQITLLTLLGACTLLLGFGVSQLHSLEGRLITQERQFRALGEAHDKLASDLKRANTLGAPAAPVAAVAE
ncbi:MAG: hypothetical protein RJA70_4345, partial [Pseudomonadota bacterium]